MATSRVVLIARRSLTYGGRAIAAGDPFEAAAVDAAALVYQGRAVFREGGTLPSPRRDGTAIADPPRRRYRRRDLTVEDP